MNPRFGFGVFTLLMVAVFIGLGLWQLQRRIEKHALISALNERIAAEPVPLPEPLQWAHLTPSKDEFRRVRFTAILDPVAAARVYSSGSAVRDDISGPGTWEFWPATVPGNAVVAVNMGFVPDTTAGRPSAAGSMTRFVIRLPSQVTGYIRFPESAGILSPSADIGKRLWFTRDQLAMARALGWDKDGRMIAPFYIDLELPVARDAVPKPGPLAVHLKDDHLQYAITWFALAGAVMIAFLVWLRRSGRA
jgi:cytochrome oxidase assembly protein ShyY1